MSDHISWGSPNAAEQDELRALEGAEMVKLI